MMGLQIIVPLLIFLSLGCQETTEVVTDKQHAEDLLNQNRYSQAKDILKQLHTENPTDDKVAVMLATAYAGSVGLNVIDAWRMFEPMFFQEYSAKLLADSREDPENKSEHFEKETYKFFASLAKDFNILGRLPKLDRTGRVEINEALLVLTTVTGDKPNFLRAQLYSVFLNLFQFSGVLRDSFPNLPEGTEFEFASIVCEFNPSLFFQNIELGLTYLTNAASSMESVGSSSSLRPNIKLHMLKKSAAQLNEMSAKSEANTVTSFASKSAIDKAMCEPLAGP